MWHLGLALSLKGVDCLVTQLPCYSREAMEVVSRILESILPIGEIIYRINNERIGFEVVGGSCFCYGLPLLAVKNLNLPEVTKPGKGR